MLKPSSKNTGTLHILSRQRQALLKSLDYCNAVPLEEFFLKQNGESQHGKKFCTSHPKGTRGVDWRGRSLYIQYITIDVRRLWFINFWKSVKSAHKKWNATKPLHKLPVHKNYKNNVLTRHLHQPPQIECHRKILANSKLGDFKRKIIVRNQTAYKVTLPCFIF